MSRAVFAAPSECLQAAARVRWVLDNDDFSGEYGLVLKAGALHALAVARLRQERFLEVEPLCEPGLVGSAQIRAF